MKRQHTLIAIAIVIVSGCAEKPDPRLAEANQRIEQLEAEQAQIRAEAEAEQNDQKQREAENNAQANKQAMIQQVQREWLAKQAQIRERDAEIIAQKERAELEAKLRAEQARSAALTDQLRSSKENKVEGPRPIQRQTQKKSVATFRKPKGVTVDVLRRLLRGKTEADIKALFGPPDFYSKSGTDGTPGPAYTYYSGAMHPITEKPSDLYIRFSPSGSIWYFQPDILAERIFP